MAVSKEQIYDVLPHRQEFALLDGVVMIDVQARRMVAFKDVRPQEWWTRGHIPGRPLLPGVLMIEAAAQMASYYTHVAMKDRRFWGFSGVDRVKFREAVSPPARLYLIGEAVELRRRRTVCQVQGLVQGRIVFEAKITGMPV
ncbi:MAG: 3-hydroxyacyl-ACP dehydratase FabZ family protein [Phycisphaerae bacterium]